MHDLCCWSFPHRSKGCFSSARSPWTWVSIKKWDLNIYISADPACSRGECVRGEIISSKRQEVITSSKGQEARSQEERKRSKVQKQGQEQEVRSEQARGRSKRQEKRKLSRQEAARTSNKRQFWCGDTSLFWRSDGYNLELVSCQFRKHC